MIINVSKITQNEALRKAQRMNVTALTYRSKARRLANAPLDLRRYEGERNRLLSGRRVYDDKRRNIFNQIDRKYGGNSISWLESRINRRQNTLKMRIRNYEQTKYTLTPEAIQRTKNLIGRAPHLTQGWFNRAIRESRDRLRRNERDLRTERDRIEGYERRLQRMKRSPLIGQAQKYIEPINRITNEIRTLDRTINKLKEERRDGINYFDNKATELERESRRIITEARRLGITSEHLTEKQKQREREESQRLERIEVARLQQERKQTAKNILQYKQEKKQDLLKEKKIATGRRKEIVEKQLSQVEKDIKPAEEIVKQAERRVEQVERKVKETVDQIGQRPKLLIGIVLVAVVGVIGLILRRRR